MHNIEPHNKGYLLAAAVGAIGGGLLVAVAAKAISNIVPFMKEKMAGGCP
jgi:hypothetical protein